MLLVTTALSGLMAGAIQTAPPQTAAPQTPPATASAPAGAGEVYDLGTVVTAGVRARGSVNSDIPPDVTLKANFRSLVGQLSSRAPTQGGRNISEIEGNALHIAGATRWSMDAEYERSTPL